MARSEVAERYAAISEGFGARVAGVAPDRWQHPSPCTEWTATQLVDHVIGVHRRVLATLKGSEPAALGADDDRLAAWEQERQAVLGALGDEEQASKTISGMFGEQSFESLVGRLVAADTLVHTWDLARATGQDEHLDPDAVAKAMVFLQPIDEAIRRPGGFARKIEPAPDADPQTRLLNFCGRAV
jgi:uncharacterized protein (TIGR03086 family)